MNRYIPALLFTVILAFTVYSQTNPFFADYHSNPITEHWMLSQYNDSITGSWSFIQPLQQPLLGVNAYYWSQNNKVFVCGGATQQVAPQSQCYWYNIDNNTYEPAASLPAGRWSGKFVRVKDSLYLIGSVDSTFNSADGIIYKYSLNQNEWVVKDTMPVPYVHECAVAVINDSLVVTIGGSTNSFTGAVNIVRVYNPRTNSWTVSPTPYPVNNTSAHAECLLTADTTYSIFVLGGYGSGVLNFVCKGAVSLGNNDSISVQWDNSFDTLKADLFGQGVYRVAGAKWGNYALFGPAMNGANAVNQVWALQVDNANHRWIRFDPKTIDTAGNISTYGVKSGNDTNYLFLFGGYKNPNVVSSAQKYSFTDNLPPIGIVNNGNHIPSVFRLYQNYPNPFNPVTKIKFDIPVNNKAQSFKVKLIVYDILGREVYKLFDGELSAGTYETEFNAASFASGLYFYRLTSDVFNIVKKMIVIK